MEQEKKSFVAFTKEQKTIFGKQFSKQEKLSYYKGKRNAYSHMANTARRQSFFAGDNIKNDEANSAPTAPPRKAAPAPVTPLEKMSKEAGAKKTTPLQAAAPLEADTPPAKAFKKPDNNTLAPSKTEFSVANNGQRYVTKVYEPANKKAK